MSAAGKPYGETNEINNMIYAIIAVILFAVELIYLRIARHFHLMDIPVIRSSHKEPTLIGGGVIFIIAGLIFWIYSGFEYSWFIAGLSLVGIVSFIDDIRNVKIAIRLTIQVVAVSLICYQLGIFESYSWWFTALAIFLGVGIINSFNFMDGINGMTTANSIAILLPLIYLNTTLHFISMPLLYITGIGLLVLGFFNFRKNAICFMGDVGAISVGFIICFALGALMLQTGDYSYFSFLIVYGVDVVTSIAHILKLHENPARSHRKYTFHLMANELHIPHLIISSSYAALQLLISAGLIFLPVNHYLYFGVALVVVSCANLCFRKKYYHLHAESFAGKK